MSDSDCSNCEERKCPFRDYSYSCYKNKVIDAQQCMTKADLKLFQRALVRAEALKEASDDVEAFDQLAYYAKQIIDLYNGE